APSPQGLGKLPLLSWVSGSHGKRRLKAELTPDMISPPLGDFRHTMHVGHGGDVFGDTSFLSNHGGANTAKTNNFFTRTLQHVRRTPLRSRGSGSQVGTSPAPPAVSPIIKNAVSLPQLNEGTYDSGSSRDVRQASSPLTSHLFCLAGLESGFCTIPRGPRLEKAQESTFPGEAELKRSDSLLSFRLDLGPSLMSELLQVISFSETNGSEAGEDSPDLPCGEGTKDGVLPALGASYGEDKATSSFWDHSRQSSLLGASSLPGLSVHANGEAHAIEGLGEDPAWALGPGAAPRGTPWQGHWNDCTIEAGEFDRAAQVLARHYGGTSTPRSSEKGEGPQQARTQMLWESPNSSSLWSQEGYAGAQGRLSNSFEYADEEEDDEVKV
uniref:CDC42 effector protein 1 n=1 Tax=Strix occidentalis caurina TaxID=311401 RepID=A0A8D0ETI8_STROC